MSWVRFVGLDIGQVRRPGFVGFVLLLITLGCDSKPQPVIVVATTWSSEQRAELEAIIRSISEDRRPIEWVNLAVGESLTRVVDRRESVDLVVGVPSWDFAKLARMGRLLPLETNTPIPWRLIRRPRSPTQSSRKSGFLIDASATLQADGWPKGYEKLIRRVASFGSRNSEGDDTPLERWDGIAVVLGGRNLDRCFSVIRALEKKGIVALPDPDARTQAMADALVDDLLRSTLIDAARELGDAGGALIRFDHPARAEAAIGERPPWPPASISKLLESDGGDTLVETLLEQIAPDPDARDWLRESWSEPKQAIDYALLLEIARAAEGRLVNEPRFRAWLRGEWTAWSRQLYRRVARLAGGYVPS